MGLYRQKGSDNWYIKYRDVRPFSTFVSDKKTAQQIFDKLKYQYSLGIYLPEQVKAKRTAPTFATLAAEYDAHVKVRLKGYAKGAKYVIAAARDYFRDRRINTIKTGDLHAYQTHLLSTGHNNETTNKYVSCARKMLKFAMKEKRWLTREEFADTAFDYLKVPQGRLRFLSIDEIDTLLSVTPKRIFDFVQIALRTGMRKGEILGLRYGIEIDMKHNIIMLSETKTDARREIHMDDELTRIFRDNPHRFKGKGQRVFPMSDQTVDYHFKRALEAAKITDFHFHDLRHTCASQLAMAGTPIAFIQKLLGHKRIEQTMKYAHLDRRQGIETVQKMSDILARKTA